MAYLKTLEGYCWFDGLREGVTIKIFLSLALLYYLIIWLTSQLFSRLYSTHLYTHIFCSIYCMLIILWKSLNLTETVYEYLKFILTTIHVNRFCLNYLVCLFPIPHLKFDLVINKVLNFGLYTYKIYLDSKSPPLLFNLIYFHV